MFIFLYLYLHLSEDGDLSLKCVQRFGFMDDIILHNLCAYVGIYK
jgi:hypothetical protein